MSYVHQVGDTIKSDGKDCIIYNINKYGIAISSINNKDLFMKFGIGFKYKIRRVLLNEKIMKK